MKLLTLWLALVILKLTGAVAGLTWTLANIPLIIFVVTFFIALAYHYWEMAQDRKALQVKFPNLYKREK